MTEQEMIAFKTGLKQVAEQVINERIEMARAAMDSAQEAANSEDKSSAGDKYETGRAMGHLEKDMYARQLAENVKELDKVQKVNTEMIYPAAQVGAFVQCGEYAFFIAAGLGRQVIKDQQVFFLSPDAPIAKILFNKKPGDHFLFNKKETLILAVF
jgi:transcription elongation GreA/GreB family factor